MNTRLIDNALDFVVRASVNLWDAGLTEEQQLKYSTIHLFEGIELFLKARLMKDHWSLILRDVDKYRPESFVKGDFQSVNYELARGRLESICGVNLEEQAHQAFEGLRQLRNRYVHFVCNETRNSVMATQLKAWHHALRLIEGGLLDLSENHNEMLKTAKEQMLRSEEFLETRFREVQPELQKARDEGRRIVMCPTCGKLSLLLGEGWPDCKVCSKNDATPQWIADRYAAIWNPFWRHPRHGPDDEVAWCEYCEDQACVPVGADLQDEIEQELSKTLKREPGQNFEAYLCFSCGQAAADWFLRGCGSCGERYFASEDSYGLCPVCGRF